jgi:hypothetical protein
MNDTPEKTAAIACFLDGNAYRARVARIRALMAQALSDRGRLETSIRLRFRLDAEVEANLKELVTLEQECCPFLTFALDKMPGEMVLSISGPESAAALLDGAFGGALDCQAVPTPARHRRTAWAVTAGAITAAFGVATCCALPLALALFGLGTATSLTMIGAWVAPYKGLVSIVAGMGIAAGFFLAYRPRKDRCGDTDACATPTNTRAMQAVLWLALLLLLGAIIVP